MVHLMVAPYTKVEESFNMQATHDLIFYGPWNLTQYDHHDFPGAVKRTFIGPIALWLVTWPITSLLKAVGGSTKIAHQYVVRCVMAVGVASSLAAVNSAIRVAHGRVVSQWFMMLTLSQFHIMFWSSRTLPNTFAFILFNHALSKWIYSDGLSGRRVMVFLLVFAITVFRSELALIAAFMVLTDLARSRYPIKELVVVGLVSFSVALVCTVGVDSYFWSEAYLWPELEAFIFNAINNKSAEWGVSPFHSYFTALLPRIAPVTWPLSLLLFRLVSAHHGFSYYVVALCPVAVLSMLGHKEWRFILYAVPVVNAISAIGLVRLTAASRRVPQWSMARLAVVGIYAAIFLSFVAQGCMLAISAYNYPGGWALNEFHRILHSDKASKPCVVHMDVYSTMTGITRFGEGSECLYSKNENHTNAHEFLQYTHLVTHEPHRHSASQWQTVAVVRGYAGIRKMSIKLDPMVYILSKFMNETGSLQ